MQKDEELIDWAVRSASIYFRELSPNDVGSPLFVDGDQIGVLNDVTGDWCTILRPSGMLERMPIMQARYMFTVPDDKDTSQEGSL